MCEEVEDPIVPILCSSFYQPNAEMNRPIYGYLYRLLMSTHVYSIFKIQKLRHVQLKWLQQNIHLKVNRLLSKGYRIPILRS